MAVLCVVKNGHELQIGLMQQFNKIQKTKQCGLMRSVFMGMEKHSKITLPVTCKVKKIAIQHDC